LLIVLIGKPLAAIAIVVLIGYPARTALTVGLALGQIGEFSFILGDLARQHGLVDEAATHVLVACALVSITLNPLIFKLLDPIESMLKRSPGLWQFMNRGAQKREIMINEHAAHAIDESKSPIAVIVGYGPVGRAVDSVLRGSDLQTVIVDLNMDTVESLTRQG